MEKFHMAQELHWLMLSLKLTYNSTNKPCQSYNLNFCLIYPLLPKPTVMIIVKALSTS